MSRFHFFGLLARLRWVKRWALKFNLYDESVVTHSFEVSVIAHSLALIRQEITGGDPAVDANALAVKALFHDCSEAVVGDAPTPTKYATPAMTAAYKSLEASAEAVMLDSLPEPLRPAYRPLLISSEIPDIEHRLIKAADLISALVKAESELSMGNREFKEAVTDVKTRLDGFADLPEVGYFMEHCFPSYHATLDKQLAHQVSEYGES